MKVNTVALIDARTEAPKQRDWQDWAAGHDKGTVDGGAAHAIAAALRCCLSCCLLLLRRWCARFCQDGTRTTPYRGSFEVTSRNR